jgi:hypothetical protein
MNQVNLTRHHPANLQQVARQLSSVFLELSSFAKQWVSIQSYVHAVQECWWMIHTEILDVTNFCTQRADDFGLLTGEAVSAVM